MKAIVVIVVHVMRTGFEYAMQKKKKETKKEEKEILIRKNGTSICLKKQC